MDISLSQIKKKIRPYFPVWEVSVGAIVYSQLGDQPQYLLLQYLHGHWDFVKGHKEHGEKEEQTLWRELEEETGIQEGAILPNFRQEVRFWYIAKGDEREKRIRQGRALLIFKKVVFYACQVKTHNVKISHEHRDFTWLPYDQAMRRATFEKSRNLLKEVHQIVG